MKQNKKLLIVYIVLILLIFLCLTKAIIDNNFQKILFCIFCLILFTTINLVEKLFKIHFSSNLKITILIFLFCSEILGRVYGFYCDYIIFDKLIHLVSGFIFASFGFSLIYLLNKNIKSLIFINLVTICFSISLGVAWEFFEYIGDVIFKSDMQQNQFINEVSLSKANEEKNYELKKIKDIEYIILYDKNNNEIKRIDGYLDIGLNDTMQDLIANFIGGFVFCIFGTLYINNKEKYKFIRTFLVEKNIN